MERACTVQGSPRAARTPSSTACRLSTGRAPGSPRHTGHTCSFGSAPNSLTLPQKSLVAVLSWTWISSPMTGSKPLISSVGAVWLDILASRQALLECRRDFDDRALTPWPTDELRSDGQAIDL